MGIPLQKEQPDLGSAIEQWKKSTAVRELILANSEVSFAKQFAFILTDWLVIFGAAFLSQQFFNPLSYLAAVLIIATRQHALLILMHDGSHFRLSNNRLLNDLTSDFLTAFPFLGATSWYRRHHAAHHRHLNTDQDPDWARKIHLQEWQFPQSVFQMTKTFTKQVLIGGFEWVYLMVLMGIKVPETRTAKAIKALYYLGAFATIHWLNLWSELVLFWLVPLFFVFPSLQRFRSMTEHFGLERSHELKDARNTLSNPIETFCLSPHGTNFHLVHHLFPSVPHYKLRKVHEKLMTFPLYAEESHHNASYLFASTSVLRDLLDKPPKKES
ncbi:MAG: fatty acid desaturase family protein [Bdellovibrionaceae bacterium]|nr:fatty acid desaturase family protein [Pseudobdellovibrionaceae bacterium]